MSDYRGVGLKFWLHRFYIQNAAEYTILRPSELFFFGWGDNPPNAFSLSRVGMYAIMHILNQFRQSDTYVMELPPSLFFQLFTYSFL
jgi:hypothetical protein